MAAAADLESAEINLVGVQVPLSAPSYFLSVTSILL